MMNLRLTPTILSALKKRNAIKTVFLLTSVCMSFHITPSHIVSYINSPETSKVALTAIQTGDEIDTQANPHQVSDETTNPINSNELENKSVAESNNTEIASLTESNLITKLWYGIAKLAGKTATATFLELYAAGKLEADLQKDPKEAISRLNDAITERFTRRDLYNAGNQNKIREVFEIVDELRIRTGKVFALDKIFAQEYNPLQQIALEIIIALDADEVNRLEAERDAAITAAHDAFEQKFESLRVVAAMMANNKRNLTQYADATANYLEKEIKYTDLAAYRTHLRSVGNQLKQKNATTLQMVKEQAEKVTK